MQPKPALILALLITFLIAFNVHIFSNPPQQKQTVMVTRVIDGDTLIVDNQTTIRLENINTPERGEQGYEEAKNFLQQYENREVQIEISGLDKYRRTLARIYTSEYLNLEIVKKGFAKKFLVDDKEAKIFAQAEVQAIESEQGLWKKSKYFNCFTSRINNRKEMVTLTNTCPEIDMKDWTLQEEGRKRYKFSNLILGEVNIHTKNGTNNETDLFLGIEGEIWDNDRDTLYLFDSENNLVHHNSYGY